MIPKYADKCTSSFVEEIWARFDPIRRLCDQENGCRFVLIGIVCAVDLIPGSKDPTNVMLPQTPIPSWLLPSTSKFATFLSSGNPHYAEVGGQRVLFLSGEFLHGGRQFGVNTADLSRSNSWNSSCVTGTYHHRVLTQPVILSAHHV